MCIAEWDEKLVREWTTPIVKTKTLAADPERSRRAEQEFQKKRKAYITVRPPQEQLDPRILELVSNPSVQDHARPILYYGLIFRRSDREAYIQRNGLIKPGDLRTPSAVNCYEAIARAIVKTSLSVKCMLPLKMIQPFAVERDMYVLALDDTGRMYQNQKEVLGWWDARVSHVLKTLRRELCLGDQQLKWYWGEECDTRYQCPIPDYNPPQVRYGISESESESESDDEAEDDDDDDGPGLNLRAGTLRWKLKMDWY